MNEDGEGDKKSRGVVVDLTLDDSSSDEEDYFCYESHFEYDPQNMDKCTREFSLIDDNRRLRDTVRELIHLDEDKLRQVASNDTNVTELVLRRQDWIEGAGRVIGQSRVLRDLEICYDRPRNDYTFIPCENNETWLEELCRGVSNNRSIELFRLRMNWYESKLDVFLAIAPLFEYNSKLRYLELYRVEPGTMKQLSDVLSVCKNCQLEHIYITKAEVPEKGVATFINSLNNLHSLLDLRFEQIYLGNTGSEALATLLNNPESKIEKLVMDDNRLGNNKSEGGVIFLRNALAINTTLKFLSFFFDDGDTSLEVWEGIVECMANPNAKLEDLSLKSKDIGDDGIICLADALADNQTLNVLDMIEFTNNRITLEGWQALSDCLRNPITTLEQLLLRHFTIDEEGMMEIIMALEENSRLKKLQITCDNDVEDGLVWEVLDQILCDTTSICCTFSSNHTLQDVTITFEYEDVVVPDDTTALLDMNKNEDKLEVARQKILNHHFSGEGTDNLPLFACMPESVLVYAVAWMGRNNLGYSLMYDIVRGFPHLFDNRSLPQRDEAGKKRKHSRTLMDYFHPVRVSLQQKR